MPLLEERPQLKPIDLKLFAHLHNDANILGTFLQGNTFMNTASYVFDMMKYIQTNNCKIEKQQLKTILEQIAKTKEQFTDLITFEEGINKAIAACKAAYNRNADNQYIQKHVIDKIMAQLAKANTVLIPGGWIGLGGKRGHAMCYKLQKDKDGGFHFLVYNTGAGIDNHRKKTKSKDKYVPVKAYYIPPAEKGKEANLQPFLLELMTPLIKPMFASPYQDNQKLIYDAPKIYDEVIGKIAFLGGKEIDPTPFCSITTQGQLSGTCAMRVLMPLLHGEMKGPAFQEFLYQLRLQSIIDFYKGLKEDQKKDPAVQNELRWALEKFSRLTKKLMHRKLKDKPVLSEARGQESLEMVETIRKEMKAHEMTVAPKTIEPESALLGVKEFGFQMPQGLTHTIQTTSEKQTYIIPENIIPLEEARTPLNYLREAYQRLLKNDQHHYREVIIQNIEQLFLSFPIEAKEAAAFWEGLSPEEAKESLDLIQNILRLYGKQCFLKGGISLPQSRITSLSALLSASTIANQYFKNDKNFQYLADVLLSSDPLKSDNKLIRDPFSVSLDPKFDSRLSSIEKRVEDLRKIRTSQFSKDADTEFYDIELIEKHNALRILNRLGPPIAKDQFDNARIYLYKLVQGSLDAETTESAKKELAGLLSDLDYCTQFSELKNESLALLRGQFDHFKSIPYHEVTPPLHRLKKFFYASSRDRSLQWKNLTSGYAFDNGTKITATPVQNPKDIYQLENPILDEMFFAQRFTDDRELYKDTGNPTYESNEALVHFEGLRRKAEIPEKLKRELWVHSIPFTRNRSSTCRVIATLDFFDQNLDKLNQHDYQMLFLLNMFTPSLLEQQLQETPELAEKIIIFLDNCLKYHSKAQKLEEGGLFALKASYQLLKYLKAHPQNKILSGQIQKLRRYGIAIDDYIEKNNKKLLDPKLGEKQKDSVLKESAVLHRMNILYAIDGLEIEQKLNAEKLGSILNSILSRSLALSPRTQINDALVEGEIDRGLVKMEPVLNKAFKGLDINLAKEMVQKLIKSHLIGIVLEDTPYEFEINFPILKISQNDKQDIAVDLSTGQIKKAGELNCCIPEIFYTQDFIKFFGNIPLFGKINLNANQRMCEFNFKSNVFRVILDDSGKIHIQMHSKSMNTWLELQDSAALQQAESRISKKLKIPRHFYETDKLIWLDTTGQNQYYITDRKFDYCCAIKNLTKPDPVRGSDATPVAEREVKRHAEQNLTVQLLNKNGSDANYHLINPESDANNEHLKSLIQMLSNVESAEFIELWSNGKPGGEKQSDLVIRLPRYGLEFFADQNKAGKWDFVWKENPNYKLKLTSSAEFEPALFLEPRNIDDKSKKQDQLVLIPKQVFYTSETEEQHKKDASYYQMVFDKTNAANNAHLGFVQQSSGHHLWKYTNQSTYMVCKLDNNNDPIPQNTNDALYLAYVYLAENKTLKALDMLRLCKKMGGIKGSFEEIEWIKNIVNEIPAYVDVKLSTPTARKEDPETLAVRLHALNLLMDFKETSMDTPQFPVKLPKQSETITHNNEIILNARKKAVIEFYKNTFMESLNNEYIAYHKVLGNVPIDMQLSPNAEKQLLQSLYRDQHNVVFLGSRLSDLELISLKKELENLEKMEEQEKVLSEENRSRLTSIKDQLKLGAKGTRIKEQLEVTKKPLMPNVLALANDQFATLHGSKNRYYYGSSKTVPIKELNMMTDPGDFLFSFENYYALAIESEAGYNQAEKQKLKDYVESIVTMQETAKYPLPKDLETVANLSRLLCYALKFSGEKWPKFDNENEPSVLSSLTAIQEQCLTIAKATPIVFEYIKPTPKEKEYNIAGPPTEKLEPISLNMILDSEEFPKFNLASELSLGELQKTVNELEIKASFDVPDLIGKVEDDSQFMANERQHLKKDYAAGKANNEARALRAKHYAENLDNVQRQKALQEMLNQSIEKEANNLNDILKNLENFANKAIVGDRASLSTKLSVSGKEKNKLVFKDLLFLYMEGDKELFKQQTFLDSKEVDKLYKDIHQYLLLATAQQQRKRAVKVLTDIQTKGNKHPEYASLLETLGNELLNQRAYNPATNPEMLVFEYSHGDGQGTLIRPAQAKILASLLEKDPSGYKSKVLQLIMGGGKSKVLLPILALKKANGTNLSIIEVPDALFKTNVVDLNITTSKLFGKNGYPFIFHRETNCESKHLTALHEKLKSVIRNREYLIISPESIQALELKYLEHIRLPMSELPELKKAAKLSQQYASKDKEVSDLRKALSEKPDESAAQKLVTMENDLQKLKIERDSALMNAETAKIEYQQKIKGFESILGVFKTRGDVIIDEVDSVLDPKRELNFTIGLEQAIPPEKLKMFLDVFNLLPQVSIGALNNTVTLQQIANFEKSIPKEDLWNEALDKLAFQIIADPKGPLFEYFKTDLDLNQKELQDFILGRIKEIPKMLSELDETKRGQIFLIKETLEYIRGKGDEIPKFLFDIEAGQSEKNALREKIAMMKAQLQFMPYILKRNPNEHFGLPRSETPMGHPELAIPYIANNTPNERAQFGTVFETIFYTLRLQKNPQKLLPLSVVKDFLADYKAKVESEVAASLDTIPFEETNTAQKFLKMTGMKLSDLSSNDINALTGLQLTFSNNPEIKDYCILNYIISNVKEANAILRSDGVNHVSQYRSVQGFTGTPWNYRCYHPNMSFKVSDSLGIDGQTIDVLVKKNPRVSIVAHTDPAKVLAELYSTHAKSTDIHAFIDVGALFKGITNQKVAEDFATFFAQDNRNPIQHILYFNEENQLCALPIDRENKTFKQPIFIGSTDKDVIVERIGSTPEQCFTYYDQRHTTGTDITQPINGIGLLTLDKETPARDYLQGGMRMRDLAGSHNLEIIIPKSVAELRPDVAAWNGSAVMKFTLENQYKKLSDLHFQAAIQKMNNTLREYFMSLIYFQKTPEEKNRLYQIFSEKGAGIFEVSASESVFEQFGKIERERPVSDILKNMASAYLKKWEDLLSKARIQPSSVQREAITSGLDIIATETAENCFKMRKHVPQFGEDTAVEIQREKEKELEQQLLRQEAKRKALKHQRLYNEARNFFVPGPPPRGLDNPINEMLKASEPKPGFHFDNNIFVSDNFRFTYQGQQDPADRFRKPINFYLVQQDPPPEAQLKAVIITEEEAEEIHQLFKREPLRQFPGKLWIISPNDTLLMGSTPSIEHPQFGRIREQIRFLNADIPLLAKNVGQVDWMVEQTPEKIEYLQTVIFANMPEKRRDVTALKESLGYRKLHQALLESIKSKNVSEFNAVIKQIEEMPDQRAKRAILNAKNPEGYSAYTWALQHKTQDILQKIIQYPLMLPSIQEAGLQAFEIACEDEKIFRELCGMKEATFDSNNPMAWSTLLQRTIVSNNAKASEFLLSEIRKLPENVQKEIFNSKSKEGESLAMFSIKNQLPQIAAMLLKEKNYTLTEDIKDYFVQTLLSSLKSNAFSMFAFLMKVLRNFPEGLQKDILNKHHETVTIEKQRWSTGVGSRYGYGGGYGRSETYLERHDGSLVYLAEKAERPEFLKLLLENPSVELRFDKEEKLESFLKMASLLHSKEPDLLRSILLRQGTYPESTDTKGWVLVLNHINSFPDPSYKEIVFQQAKTLIDEKSKNEIFEVWLGTVKGAAENAYEIAQSLNVSSDKLLAKAMQSKAWNLCAALLKKSITFPQPKEIDEWRFLLKSALESQSDEIFTTIFAAFDKIEDAKIKGEILNGCGTRNDDDPLLFYFPKEKPSDSDGYSYGYYSSQKEETRAFSPHILSTLLKHPLLEVSVKSKATGKSLLHAAIENENALLTSLLLGDIRSDLNAQDNEGLTPFMAAITTLNLAVVKGMLESDRVDLGLKTKSGVDALGVSKWPMFIRTNQQHQARFTIRQLIQTKMDEIEKLKATPQTPHVDSEGGPGLPPQ